MKTLCLALPKAHQQLHSVTLSKQVPFSLETILYDSLEELTERNEHPLLAVIETADYDQWLKIQAQSKSSCSAIILESKTNNGSNTQNHASILNWVPQTIANPRWSLLVEQAALQLHSKQQVGELEKKLNQYDTHFKNLNEIGVSLSGEDDLDTLLPLIVAKTMELTHADGGSLYLVEAIPDVHEDPHDYLANKHIRFQVATNFSTKISLESRILPIAKETIYGHAVLHQKTLNIEDVYAIDPDCEYQWSEIGKKMDQELNYRTRSMLTVPFLNKKQQVTGVIQLINCKRNKDVLLENAEINAEEVRPFGSGHVQLMESVASQVTIILENAKLVESVQTLFDGFINASVKAIESRDPTTSGHSSRVATLSIAMAETVSQLSSGPFADLHFTTDQLSEIRYASLLHDFGKIGVREKVLVKSKKLYPDEAQTVMDRFRIIRQSMELEASRKQVDYFMEKSRDNALALVGESKTHLKAQLEELDELLKFIIRSNEPTILAQGGFQQLQEIGARVFKHPSSIPTPYLTCKEVASLSVSKGSLNAEDREEIESHVTHTYNFLSIIPWDASLARVPEIAYAHHEKLDGTGYPRKLTSDEIPIQAKIMTIADIYDALTAWDRPYKKAMPPERALNILGFEAKDKHLDPELLQMFITAKLYRLVQRPEEKH